MMVSQILLAGALLAGAPEVLVRTSGDGARAETVSTLSESAIRGLSSADVDAALGEPWEGSCADDACVREAMASTSAAVVVVLSIEQQDNVFRFDLDARNARTGQRLLSAEDSCEICGLEEVAELVELRAAALASRLDPPDEGVVRVVSDPAGAVVYVDDRSVGMTPMDVPLGPGAYAIRVEKPGFIEEGRSIEVEAGVDADVRFRLMPTATSLDAEAASLERSARRWFVAGGVSLGLGVAGVAAGTPLIVMDARPYEGNCRADADGNCAKLLDTMGAGASMATAGVIGLGAGTAMLLIGRKRRAARAELAPAPGGMAVRF